MYRIKTEITIISILIFCFLVLAKDEDRLTISKQEPLTREKSLMVSLKYGNGYITIGKSENKNIYEGEFIYSGSRPDIRYDIVGDQGRLDIHFSGEGRNTDEDEESRDIESLNKLYKNDLTLNFNQQIPVDFSLDLGIVKGTMEFGGLKISNIDLEAGVSKTTIVFSEPNRGSMESFAIEGGVGKLAVEKLGNANTADFSFEGGVGSYELDLSGDYRQDLRGEITLGMGKLILYLPREIGARLSIDKSFLSSFDIDEVFKNGDVYTNNEWEKSKYNIDLNIESGVGKIEVVWVE